MPGERTETLIGSRRHQPSSIPSKPCQAAPGASTHADGSVARRSGSAAWNGRPNAVSGCQAVKNHEPRVAYSAAIRAIVWRKAIASRIASPVSAGPDGPSIIAAVTSLEAMIA